jgi:hypothetical protein
MVDSFKSGDWKVICYECGSVYLASELQKHWKGYYVCSKCWEPRHPQDFVRAIEDNPTPPWVQPEPEDIFVARCTPNGNSAVPGQAEPGCMVPGYVSPFYIP